MIQTERNEQLNVFLNTFFIFEMQVHSLKSVIYITTPSVVNEKKDKFNEFLMVNQIQSSCAPRYRGGSFFPLETERFYF